jgi:hypothetical protein
MIRRSAELPEQNIDARNNRELIRIPFGSELSKSPTCSGYWRRYSYRADNCGSCLLVAGLGSADRKVYICIYNKVGSLQLSRFAIMITAPCEI